MLTLEQALAELPDTADGIAAYLIQQGRKGVREDGCNCPITNYLTALGFDGVHVSDSRIRAHAAPDTDVVRVTTPWRIAEFITRFDNGEWPELALEVGESC